MDFEEIVLILIIGASALLLPQWRWWVRPWIQERENSLQGNVHLLHTELAVFDQDNFTNFIRMDNSTFQVLLDKIKNDITKEDTKFRNSISARDRLTITLRFLATGETYKSLSYAFRIGHSTISKIVPDVCSAIYKNLKVDFLKVPNSTAEWLDIAREFEEKWNFPHVLGALDGKHIIIKPPHNAGSAFYNYKGSHSIVLLALVDANYKFLFVDIGTNGRISDGGVYRNSDLARAIANNELNFPEESPLPGRQQPVPYVIVADAAFPLSNNILKPFPFRNMTRPQRIFNYRLSRARRVVENAFGILANRFRVLLTTINLDPNKVQTITLACITLHNFLKVTCPKNYDVRDNDIDRRVRFVYGLSQQAGNRANYSALHNRNEFLEYVNGIGAVHWQNDYA